MTDAVLPTIDARALPHGTCRDTILSTVSELEPGDAMVVVADHDIQPLRAMLAMWRGGRFAFTYLEDGPDVWRVRIEREA
jgi:uncharacterized protein (DUF2249 family)